MVFSTRLTVGGARAREGHSTRGAHLHVAEAVQRGKAQSGAVTARRSDQFDIDLGTGLALARAAARSRPTEPLRFDRTSSIVRRRALVSGPVHTNRRSDLVGPWCHALAIARHRVTGVVPAGAAGRSLGPDRCRVRSAPRDQLPIRVVVDDPELVQHR